MVELKRGEYHEYKQRFHARVIPNLPIHLVLDISKSNQTVLSHPIVHPRRGAGDGRVGSNDKLAIDNGSALASPILDRGCVRGFFVNIPVSDSIESSSSPSWVRMFKYSSSQLGGKSTSIGLVYP